MQADTLLEKLDDMWGITEAELHERAYSLKREKILADKVRKRDGLLKKLQSSQEYYLNG